VGGGEGFELEQLAGPPRRLPFVSRSVDVDHQEHHGPPLGKASDGIEGEAMLDAGHAVGGEVGIRGPEALEDVGGVDVADAGGVAVLGPAEGFGAGQDREPQGTSHAPLLAPPILSGGITHPSR
jgi:hypothetical protein